MDYAAFGSFLVLIVSWILLPDKDRPSEVTTPTPGAAVVGAET
jgi:hypothetical protein